MIATKNTVRRDLAWSDGWIEQAFSLKDSIEFREGAGFVTMPFIPCFWVGVIVKRILFSNAELRMYNACMYDTGVFGKKVGLCNCLVYNPVFHKPKWVDEQVEDWPFSTCRVTEITYLPSAFAGICVLSLHHRCMMRMMRIGDSLLSREHHSKLE